MIESILVYSGTAFLLYLLAKSAANRESACRGRISFGCPEFILSICLFGFITGARYDVGVDYTTYLDVYQRIQNNLSITRDTFEPGFVFVTKLFASHGVHYFFYFALWGILQFFFIYYALKDRKFLLPYVALCIMLNSAFFLNWMNGIRQCVAICAFVFLIKFIVERKLFKYIIGVLLLTLIHRSAVLLLPFYFLSYNKIILNKKILNVGILLCCVVIGIVPSWLHLMTNFSDLLGAIGYADYADQMGLMVSENLRETAWGPSRTSSFLVGVAIIWFYPNMAEFYKGSRYLPIYFFLFFIGMCLYNAFINTSHIFLRPIEYFTIFKLPMIAYLLFYLKKTGNNIMFLIISALTFSQIFIEVYKAVARPVEASRYYLYKFFFQ